LLADIVAVDTDASFITALTNRPEPPYLARFHGWQLNESFSWFPTIVSFVKLGAVIGDVKFVRLPAGGAEGWQRPPSAMFFVILSGNARSYVHVGQETAISSRFDTETGPAEPELGDPRWECAKFVPGGINLVIIAADVDDRAQGHSTFPQPLGTAWLYRSRCGVNCYRSMWFGTRVLAMAMSKAR
jgi:hypothetical protein